MKTMQPELALGSLGQGQWTARDREAVLADVHRLEGMVRAGLLGGSSMPEDVHPQIETGAQLNYHYFTLTMALNYQRNSYALWRAATATFLDSETADVYTPSKVVSLSEDALRTKLLKHRLALQPSRHPAIWRRICETMVHRFAGDVRNLFAQTYGDVGDILDVVQKQEKAGFPYLSGGKICHYWLYVMEQYTDVRLNNRHLISVAPDTHVVKATARLGLISPEVSESTRAQDAAVVAWRGLLEGTGIQPIDVHTRLWLWSRAGFPPIS